MMIPLFQHLYMTRAKIIQLVTWLIYVPGSTPNAKERKIIFIFCLNNKTSSGNKNSGSSNSDNSNSSNGGNNNNSDLKTVNALLEEIGAFPEIKTTFRFGRDGCRPKSLVVVFQTHEGRNMVYQNLFRLKNKASWSKVSVVPDLTKFQVQERKAKQEEVRQAMMALGTQNRA